MTPLFGLCFKCTSKFAHAPPWHSLWAICIFLFILPGHFYFVPAASSSFPVSRVQTFAHHVPTGGARFTVSIGLLFSTISTYHARSKLHLMILSIIMANITWIGFSTAWEPQPAAAFSVMSAGSVIWKRFTRLDRWIFYCPFPALVQQTFATNDFCRATFNFLEFCSFNWYTELTVTMEAIQIFRDAIWETLDLAFLGTR